MSMTLLESRYVKSARKPWRCSGCHRSFEAKTSKLRQRIIGYDGPYSVSWCKTCELLAEELFALDRGFWHEGVTDDDLYEVMSDRFGSWEAADKHLADVELKAKEEAIPNDAYLEELRKEFKAERELRSKQE
jgi:hypothetical protein